MSLDFLGLRGVGGQVKIAGVEVVRMRVLVVLMALSMVARAQPMPRSKAQRESEERMLEQMQAERAANEAAAEERQAKRNREQATEEAADDAIRADKKAMGAIFGATRCMLAEFRRTFLAEIATQKKYSRIGGVQNNASILRLQNNIRRVDELMASERQQLRGFRGVVVAPCESKLVTTLVDCKTTDGATCEPRIAKMAAFMPDFDDGSE